MEVLPVASLVDDTEERLELQRLRGIFSDPVPSSDVVVTLDVDETHPPDGPNEQRYHETDRAVFPLTRCVILVLVSLFLVAVAAILGVFLSRERTADTVGSAPSFPPPTQRPTTDPSASPSEIPSLTPSNTPTQAPSPTSSATTSSVAPSLAPTLHDVLPITSREELLESVDDYLSSGKSSNASLAHGRSIGRWILDGVDDLSMVFSSYRNSAVHAFNEDIGQWDLSAVWTTREMFRGASSFNQDISSWNVSRVIALQSMFWGATSFNQDISAWDVSSATTMQSMFWGATSFNQDISAWDVSHVVFMSGMFSLSTSFSQDVSSWNVSRVAYMASMFEDAASFNENISTWNVGNVQSMGRMFYRASSFNQNLCAWGNMISSDTDVVGMFASTSCPFVSDPNLTAIPPGPFCRQCS